MIALLLLLSPLAAAAELDREAILRLGVARDTEAVHALLAIAESKPDGDDAGHAARLSLARLGERKYLDEILAGLSSKKPARRLRSLRSLGFVGERSTVARVVPLLSEGGETAKVAAETLGEILPAVETQLLLIEPENADRVGQWKRWWRTARKRDPAEWGALPAPPPEAPKPWGP
jgi:hypothetical protein